MSTGTPPSALRRLALLVWLGLPLLAHDPCILATVVVAGEDPTLLHLVGDGFGPTAAAITLQVDAAKDLPFVYVNPSHLVCRRPTQARQLGLEVAGRACSYDLTLPPLALDGGFHTLQVPPGSHALAARFNQDLRAAFAPAAAWADAAAEPAGPAHTMLLDRNAGTVRVDGRRPIQLTPSELKVLVTLADLPGKACAPRELARLSFGADSQVMTKNLISVIYPLRCKLETDPNHPTFLVGNHLFGHPDKGPESAFEYRLNAWDASDGARNLPAETAPPPPASLSFTGQGTWPVSFNGKQIHLTQSQYTLLKCIYDSPGRAATWDELLPLPLPIQALDPRKAIRNLILALRRRLEPDSRRPIYLLFDENVDGKGHSGYRLNVQ